MELYAYSSKKKPKSDTNCRKPWKQVDDMPDGIMEESGIDKKIQEWDRYWSLLCWFHNLFLEKGGQYNDNDLPFAHPDCVELNDEDLDRLETVVLNLKLPICESYLDVKSEGQSLCETWLNITKKAKLEMVRTFERHLLWLDETLEFIEKARELIGEGQYIYVFSSY